MTFARLAFTAACVLLVPEAEVLAQEAPPIHAVREGLQQYQASAGEPTSARGRRELRVVDRASRKAGRDVDSPLQEMKACHGAARRLKRSFFPELHPLWAVFEVAASRYRSYLDERVTILAVIADAESSDRVQRRAYAQLERIRAILLATANRPVRRQFAGLATAEKRLNRTGKRLGVPESPPSEDDPPVEPPVEPQDTSAVVYRSDADADAKMELYAAIGDGPAVELSSALVEPDVTGFHVAPDRTFVVFAAEHAGGNGLFKTHVDGTGFVRLAPDEQNVVEVKVAPGGQLIAYRTQDDQGVRALHVVNCDGTASQLLSVLGEVLQPILWLGDRVVVNADPQGVRHYTTHTIRGDGTEMVELATTASPDGTFVYTWFGVFDDEVFFVADPDVAGNRELFCAPPDGSETARLLSGFFGLDAEPLPNAGKNNPQDMSHLFLFQSGDDRFQLGLAPATKGAPTNLTSAMNDHVTDHGWSPGGNWLWFEIGNRELWTTDGLADPIRVAWAGWIEGVEATTDDRLVFRGGDRVGGPYDAWEVPRDGSSPAVSASFGTSGSVAAVTSLPDPLWVRDDGDVQIVEKHGPGGVVQLLIPAQSTRWAQVFPAAPALGLPTILVVETSTDTPGGKLFETHVIEVDCSGDGKLTRHHGQLAVTPLDYRISSTLPFYDISPKFRF